MSVAMSQTTEKVFDYIEKNCMITAGDRVVLGVSGGADSVCLFFLLAEYRKRIPFDMAVVHVNHLVRPDAALDGEYVQTLCEREGIPYYYREFDVPRMAEEERLSSEDAGRRVRYRAFREVAGLLGGAKIAVAHNACDRAETMLLHLFRGSGLRGLCGIEPVRDDVIRPILCLERDEIEEYLESQGIAWRTDSTNEADDYTRNKVRHHILPYAEQEISAGVVEHMCRTGELVSEAEEFLARHTLAAKEQCVTDNSIDIQAFLKQEPVLRKRLILLLLEELSPTGKDISAVHVSDVLALFEKEGTQSIDLPFGIRCRRQYGRVLLERAEEESPAQDLQEVLGRVIVSDFTVDRPVEVMQNLYTKWFDYDKIETAPCVRFRQPGDFLTIADGKGGCIHKSLKNYMITEKIPKEERDRIPVVADGNHILWVVGYRISEYYKVTEQTRHILQTEYIRTAKSSETEEKMSYHVNVLLSEEEVDAKIKAIGEQISKDYEGKSVHLVCVLKGGTFFMCELAKRISVPVSLDFMSVSSYGKDTKSSGVVKIVKDLDESITGKDVLVVEDIVDSGRTLSYLMEMLADRGPASLRLCTLLDKPDRRVVDVHVDYTGFQIPDEFVVGYGLDYDQKHRNLPYIGIVEFDD